MSLPHASVATMDNVQFVNLTPLDVSPFISKCEIKVFYLGKNRNGSFINKDAAEKMALTLRGNPIVGYYNNNKEDFMGHGDRVTLDDEGIHFDSDTKPYGFVPTDAQVWFKDFDETDDFGNQVTRTYLMTTGYLWTGQYPEAQQVFDDGGKPQSMELDDSSLNGHWAEDSKSGMEFFIINDAIVSKLCILGDDVEPCFEGSSVTAPEVSNTFSMNDNFTKTLYSMVKQLEFALQGGNTVNTETNTTVDVTADAPIEGAAAQTTDNENFSATQDSNVQTNMTENQENTEGTSVESTVAPEANEEFANKEDDKKDDNTDDNSDDDNSDSNSEEEKEDEKKPASKNSLHTDEEYAKLAAQVSELTNKFAALKAENETLVEFKNSVDDQKKDELIAKFYMLSDEDKKDVIENKRKYSLDEIESKLAVICYRKKVNFDSTSTSENDNHKTEENPSVTFNLENADSDSTPDWIKAVEEIQNNI